MPVTVTTRTAPPARGAPSAIDSLFVAAKIAGAGLPTTTYVAIRSIADYIAAGATRAMDPTTYDGLDNYFREGGRQAYVARYTANLATALANFTENLGGGQVVAWGEAPLAATFQALADWAASTRRFALLDPAAVTDDTSAKLTTAATLLPASGAANMDSWAAFAPWVTIPAPDGVIGGVARQVPASSTVAALIARADALGNPNRAPAGRDFPLQYATGFVNAAGPMLDSDAVALRAVGVNPLRQKFSLLVLDGFQTKIAQDPATPFWQANCARARMWLQWRAVIVGLNYEYKPIDGRGRLARQLGSDLDAVCLELYNVNGLYGNSPGEAFATSVGVSVNTVATIAQGELHAVVEARFSLHAKTVIIELVSVPITGQVSIPAVSASV